MKPLSWDELLRRYAQVRRRHRLAGHAALPLLVVVLAVFFVLGPQQAERSQRLAAIGEAGQQRAEKQAAVANAKTYADRLRGLEGQLRSAHVVLPDNPEVPQFLAQLGTMAHDIGLSIERFEPKAEVVHAYFAEIPFHLTVRGSFHQIAMFTSQIGAMERIVNVSDFVLTLNQGEARRASVDGAFDLKIFRLLSDEQAAAALRAGKEKAEGTP